MGTRTEYAAGSFSWVDLTTNDSAGAKAFYGGLFGWDFDDLDVGDGLSYTMCKVGEDAVAAMAPATDEFPPHWNNYVTVADADEATDRTKELGGAVLQDPFDATEAGRMAVLQDPTGAAFCVWEARASIGATRVNDPGCLTWNELHSPDPAKAVEFYVDLFGWGTEEMADDGAVVYTIVKVGERSNGGAMGAQEGEPPNWLPYFTVENRDGAAEKAAGLGARELVRMEMPQGRIAVFADPQGAPFGIFEGEIDD